METYTELIEFSIMVIAIMFILYISLVAFIKVLTGYYIGKTKRKALRALKMILVRLFK